MGLRADEVAPERWSNIRILFDDGVYSVIAGVYRSEDGSKRERLGERWNGKGPLGFPSQGGNPIWYAAPPFLEVPILHGLLDELARRPKAQVPEGSVPDGKPTQAEARATKVLKVLAQRFGEAK
jgi:hypothetical protein